MKLACILIFQVTLSEVPKKAQCVDELFVFYAER